MSDDTPEIFTSGEFKKWLNSVSVSGNKETLSKEINGLRTTILKLLDGVSKNPKAHLKMTKLMELVFEPIWSCFLYLGCSIGVCKPIDSQQTQQEDQFVRKQRIFTHAAMTFTTFGVKSLCELLTTLGCANDTQTLAKLEVAKETLKKIRKVVPWVDVLQNQPPIFQRENATGQWGKAYVLKVLKRCDDDDSFEENGIKTTPVSSAGLSEFFAPLSQKKPKKKAEDDDDDDLIIAQKKPKAPKEETPKKKVPKDDDDEKVVKKKSIENNEKPVKKKPVEDDDTPVKKKPKNSVEDDDIPVKKKPKNSVEDDDTPVKKKPKKSVEDDDTPVKKKPKKSVEDDDEKPIKKKPKKTVEDDDEKPVKKRKKTNDDEKAPKKPKKTKEDGDVKKPKKKPFKATEGDKPKRKHSDDDDDLRSVMVVKGPKKQRKLTEAQQKRKDQLKKQRDEVMKEFE